MYVYCLIGEWLMIKLYRIDARKRITLPDDVLKKLEVESGDYVSYEECDGTISIKKVSIR